MNAHPLIEELFEEYPNFDTKTLSQNPKVLSRLIDIAIAEERPRDWWGIWIVDRVWREYPKSVAFLGDSIANSVPDIRNDSNKRQFTKLLIHLDFSEKHHGMIIDFAMKWLLDNNIPVAVRANSMTLLVKMAKIYPDIIYELTEAIEFVLPHAQKALLARGKMELKVLKKLKNSI